MNLSDLLADPAAWTYFGFAISSVVLLLLAGIVAVTTNGETLGPVGIFTGTLMASAIIGLCTAIGFLAGHPDSQLAGTLFEVTASARKLIRGER